jgi:hypothetical protein
MSLKIVIFLLLAASASTFLSACTSVKSKEAEEVVFDNKKSNPGNEVYITNADVKTEDQQTSFSKNGSQLEKRILSDKSVIETLVDGFGNKIETRYFTENPRLRMLVLRTSINGKQEVTVYGYGSDTKFVPELADQALTASGDEIANAAQLYATPSASGGRNFMKSHKTQTTLQPLPSSAFQQPIRQPYQPAENVQPEASKTGVNPVVQQNKSEEED